MGRRDGKSKVKGYEIPKIRGVVPDEMMIEICTLQTEIMLLSQQIAPRQARLASLSQQVSKLLKLPDSEAPAGPGNPDGRPVRLKR